MAGELKINLRSIGWTGKTVRARIWNASGQVLTVAGLTFGDYLTASIDAYRITMTELGVASCIYKGDFPAIPPGYYTVDVDDQAAGGAGSMTEADRNLGGGDVHWDGTALSYGGNLNSVAGSLTAATNLKDAYSALEIGTAQAGGASAITLRAGASSQDDYYNSQAIWILSGTGAGQTNKLLDYAGSTREGTVLTPWVVVPDNTSKYVIIGRIG